MEVFDVQTGKRGCSRQREQRAERHGLLKEVEELCVVCVVWSTRGKEVVAD